MGWGGVGVGEWGCGAGAGGHDHWSCMPAPQRAVLPHLHEQLALASIHLLHLLWRLLQWVEALAGDLRPWAGRAELGTVANCLSIPAACEVR